MLGQLAEIDPTFKYTDYVDGNFTLQEVISIRQCFLDLREENEEEECSDPAEMIQARRLRTIPFLSNEEISRCVQASADGGAS